jgi:hypothetical protein
MLGLASTLEMYFGRAGYKLENQPENRLNKLRKIKEDSDEN